MATATVGATAAPTPRRRWFEQPRIIVPLADDQHEAVRRLAADQIAGASPDDWRAVVERWASVWRGSPGTLTVRPGLIAALLDGSHDPTRPRRDRELLRAVNDSVCELVRGAYSDVSRV